MNKNRSTKHPQVRTCSFWAKRLAALRPKDLLDPKNADLAAHLQTCQSCHNLYEEYQKVARMIRALPDLHMRAGLPPQLLKEWEALDKTEPPGERMPGETMQLMSNTWQDANRPDPPCWRIAPARIASAYDAGEREAEMPTRERFC